MSMPNQFRRWMKNMTDPESSDWDDDLRYRWDRPRGNLSWLGGLNGRNLEMAEVEESVAAEQAGQVAIVELGNEWAPALLARLRQEPAMPIEQRFSREGFFTLVQLATPTHHDEELPPWEDGGGSLRYSAEDVVDLLREHDLILYLVCAEMGWRSEDGIWFSRLRAAGVPLLTVLMVDAATSDDEALVEALRRRLGTRPIVVDLHADTPGDALSLPDDLNDLVQRILSVRPRLAIPLAQEVPACRRMIADKVIRTGTLMTTLLGAEPIPLLDLPLHVAMQWKVALQLSAIYGRPGLDYRSREMLGTVALSLVVRHAAQQLIKLVPMVGWLLSGLLSGVGTWLLGQTLLRFYEEEVILPRPPKVPLDALKHGLTQGAEQIRQHVHPERFTDLYTRVTNRRGQSNRAGSSDDVQEIPVIEEW